jgi:hypothetical protein
MSVDVSPDGRTLVFDLLGDIYTMPIDGRPRNAADDGHGVRRAAALQPGRHARRLRLRPQRRRERVDHVARLRDTTCRSRAARRRQVRLAGLDAGRQLHRRHARHQSAHVPRARRRGAAAHARPRPRPGQQAFRFMGAAFGPTAATSGTHAARGQWMYNTPLPDYQLVTYDRETGDISTRTSRYGSAFRPTLSPDGRWLVYGTRHEAQTGLRIRDLRTGDERWLAYPVQRDDQESRATLDVYPGMSFTPDSRTSSRSTAAGSGASRSTAVPREIPFEAPTWTSARAGVHFEYPSRTIPTFTVRQIRDAVPSPDGRRLAFVALDRLWVMDYPAARRAADDDETWSSSRRPGRRTAVARLCTWSDADGRPRAAVRATARAAAAADDAPALYSSPSTRPTARASSRTRSPAERTSRSRRAARPSSSGSRPTGGDATFMTRRRIRGNRTSRATIRTASTRTAGPASSRCAGTAPTCASCCA